MRRNVTLCVCRSGQKRRNGRQTKFEKFFCCPRAVVPPGLKVRVIGMAIWSSAVLVSQPRKTRAVRRRWIVADDIRGNLELVRMLIDAGIRPLTNALRSVTCQLLDRSARKYVFIPIWFRRSESTANQVQQRKRGVGRESSP
jgi:hypothetical protein